jgi:hypothetical protein
VIDDTAALTDITGGCGRWGRRGGVTNARIFPQGPGQVFIFVCCGMIALLFYGDSNEVRHAVRVIV